MPKIGESETKLMKTKNGKFLQSIIDLWNKDTIGKVIAFFLFVYVFLPLSIIKYLFVFTFKLVFLPLNILMSPFKSKKKQCPKCDSRNVKEVKPTSSQKALPGSLFLLFGPIGLVAKQPKTLNVCRDCSFSWEDR